MTNTVPSKKPYSLVPLTRVSKKLYGITSLIAVALILVVALLVPQSAAASPQMEWSKTYSGDSGDAIQTADGGYAIAANNGSIMYPAWQRAPMLIKTDSSGNLQWQKTFNNVGLAGITSIVQTKDGGYVLSGTDISPPISKPVYSGWVIKTDDKGTVQWNKTVDLPIETCFVIQTSDGGYALTGYVPNISKGDDGLLVKMDRQGTTEWNKTFSEGTSKMFILSMVQSNDTGYVLVGNLDLDGWLAKTDAAGNLQWTQTYHPSESGSFPLNAVAKTSDGGYILAGGKLDRGFLVKTDANGNSQWSREYSECTIVKSVVQTADGGFIAASALNRQACVIRTDSSGILLYNALYGEVSGNVSSYASSVVLTSDGGYAVAGTLNHYSPTTIEGFNVTLTGANSVWLAKFSAETLASETNSEPSDPNFEFAALIAVSLLVAAIASVIFYRRKQSKNSKITLPPL